MLSKVVPILENLDCCIVKDNFVVEKYLQIACLLYFLQAYYSMFQHEMFIILCKQPKIMLSCLAFVLM